MQYSMIYGAIYISPMFFYVGYTRPTYTFCGLYATYSCFYVGCIQLTHTFCVGYKQFTYAYLCGLHTPTYTFYVG